MFIYLIKSKIVLCVLVGGELVGAFIYILEATGGTSMGFWGAATKSSGKQLLYDIAAC